MFRSLEIGINVEFIGKVVGIFEIKLSNNKKNIKGKSIKYGKRLHLYRVCLRDCIVDGKALDHINVMVSSVPNLEVGSIASGKAITYLYMRKDLSMDVGLQYPKFD